MADRMQGIVRYAREICNSIDAIENDVNRWILCIPSNAEDVPEFKKIIVNRIGKHKGILWEQIDLKNYVQKNSDCICLNLCNVVPFGVKAGITTIHDIMYKENPQDYTTFRNIISRIWHCIQYGYICRHEQVILTDSRFSKSQIENNYPSSRGKIEVIYCGWQHVEKYQEDPEWKKKYEYLVEGNYYFSLSTLSRNKNGKWIIEVAKRNPHSTFVIAGKYYESDIECVPENVHLLGFVSDDDACSLIKHCKAFIHPALYEGFGLPPLEAMALGATVIASNTTSLPEILKNCVHYINPYDYDLNIDNLLQEDIDCPETVLDNFSWITSADKLINIVNKM